MSAPLTQTQIAQIRLLVGEGGTARERTRRACDAMVSAGIQPRSWIQIKSIIGRGSNSDINQALQAWRADFFARPATTLNLPTALLGAVQTLMEVARTEARIEIETQHKGNKA